jgi:hypothetical protein
MCPAAPCRLTRETSGQLGHANRSGSAEAHLITSAQHPRPYVDRAEQLADHVEPVLPARRRRHIHGPYHRGLEPYLRVDSIPPYPPGSAASAVAATSTFGLYRHHPYRAGNR